LQSRHARCAGLTSWLISGLLACRRAGIPARAQDCRVHASI
jgi:hypothetical protein